MPGDQTRGRSEGLKRERRKLERNVDYVDFRNDFTGVNTCQTYQMIHFKYVWFIVYQLYINKAVCFDFWTVMDPHSSSFFSV